MKKHYWMLVLAGLIAFVTLYAFVFPQSQMPIRLAKLGQCASFVPPKGSLYIGNWFVIDDTGNRMDLPQPMAKLPEGLRWDRPKVASYHKSNGTLYATLLDKTYMFDGKQWSPSMMPLTADAILDDKGFYGKRIVAVKDGRIILSSSLGNSGQITIPITGRPKINDFMLPVDPQGFPGISIGRNKYYLTEPSVGRIRKESSGILKLLDRSQLEAQAIPTDMTTDGKEIFVLLSDFGNSIGNYSRIQVYDKNLEYVREFAKTRTKAKPAAIEYYKSMVIVLWDDGLLESYSPEGNLLCSWTFGTSGVDLASVGDTLLFMDETTIEAVSINVVKPNMPIWPRIVSMGLVDGIQKTSIFIKATSEPKATVKGDNVSIEKISNQKGIWKLDMTINTQGLSAFVSHNAELALDIDQTHEIVPISFVPFGEIKEFYIFGDKAIDMDNGNKISVDGLEKLGKVIVNEFTNQTFILSPPPGKLIGE